MSTELQLNAFDSLSQSDTLAHNLGNNNDINVKKIEGLATLGDGTAVSFRFELTKLNSEPVADITDENGDYVITIEKL